MTIAVPTSGGWTFEAHLEEDEFGMLWLNSPNRVTGKRQGRYLLSAVLKIGWRIVESSWLQMYPTLPFSVGTGYLVLPIAGVLFVLMDCAVFKERRA